ncbi:MAG: tail fiber domain-containing protein [Pseudobdellovibrio sp.]
MENQNMHLDKVYCGNKNLISRRNQDNTVIIMKLDDANVFYKIDGLASNIWHLFQSPANAQNVFAAFTAKFNTDEAKSDFNTFFAKLNELNFLVTTTENVPATKNQDIEALFAAQADYNFGKVKDYDLAQIESEVLNESIYLDVFAGSDLRLKKDVHPLENSLQKILALEGISYLWNETALKSNAPTNSQIGLIAQQVASVIPDLVKKDAATNLLAINYTKLTPYLVESIKELKSIIDQQNEKISNLESELKKLKH